MTLGTLATKISAKLKDENNTVVSAVNVKTAINDAIKYWKKRGRHLWFNEFEEDVTLTVGNPAFSLTTNVLAIFKHGGMVITDNNIRYELLKVSTSRFDFANIEAPGRPYIWTYRDQGYECYFYPDQAYTLTARGYKSYSDFATDGTDDAETNDWLDEAESLIEYEALSRLYADYRQDENLSEKHRQNALKEFEALKLLHREKVGTGRNITHSCLI